MPRVPYDVARARRLLKPWVDEAIGKPADEAPITREAAAAYLTAKGVETHPATLSKYKLTQGFRAARDKQSAAPRARRVDAEAAAYHAQLDELRAQNKALDARNRALLAEIATMTYNARRLGVPHAQLTADVPATDRSRSRAGRGGRGGTAQ